MVWVLSGGRATLWWMVNTTSRQLNNLHTDTHTRTYTERDSALSTSESTESEPQEKPEPSYPRYQSTYSRGLAQGPAIAVLEKIKEAEAHMHLKVD